MEVLVKAQSSDFVGIKGEVVAFVGVLGIEIEALARAMARVSIPAIG
jgi:hypothetical protein